MSQFGSTLNQSMQTAGSNLVGAALSAADAAGADMGQFSQGLGSAILPPVQQAAQAVDQGAGWAGSASCRAHRLGCLQSVR